MLRTLQDLELQDQHHKILNTDASLKTQDLAFEVASDAKYNMLYLRFHQIQDVVFEVELQDQHYKILNDKTLYLRFPQIQDLVFEVAGDVKYNMLYLPLQHVVLTLPSNTRSCILGRRRPQIQYVVF